MRVLRNNQWIIITYVLLIFSILFLSFGGAAYGSSGEEDGAHSTKVWVDEDTYRVVNFSVLFIALFLLLKKPVANALNQRIDGIRQQLDDLSAKKSEAEKKLAEYNEKISKLGNETDKIIAQYVKQGEEAKARILEEAEAAANKLEEQAGRNIEHEFKAAKTTLRNDILEKALAKAEEIVKNKITSEDQDRLVDEYLDKVVAQ